MRVSLATAACLGLRQVRLAVAPTTGYLLAAGGCRQACHYCPQGHSGNGADRLARVNWAIYSVEEVLRAWRERQPGFARLCLQSVDNEQWFEQRQVVIPLLRELGVPLSVCSSGSTSTAIRELFDLGVQRVGIPLDAASAQLARSVGRGGWKQRYVLLAEMAASYPGRVATHLIVGLGETEEEACRLVCKLGRLGASCALFAFTPVPGTPLAGRSPPSMCLYRRLQLVNFLSQKGLIGPADLEFSAARLQTLEFPASAMEYLLTGEPFRTAGCPGCNRPFYTEGPAGPIYNYPRPLTAAEVRTCMAETRMRLVARPGGRLQLRDAGAEVPVSGGHGGGGEPM